MDSKTRVRAIIPKDKGIIVIKRTRKIDDQDVIYYVFPGGGVEENETNEDAIHREIEEELGIQIEQHKVLYQEEYNEEQHLFYLCKHISGEIGTGKGPEYTAEEYASKGQYEPVILSWKEMKNADLIPNKLKEMLIQNYIDAQELEEDFNK